MTMNINDIIKKPYVTEKANSKVSLNVYQFVIDKRATRSDVKRAIEYIFAKSNAKVEKVNIMNVRPKNKKVGKFAGLTASFKKAIVTLKSGSIPVYGFEGVEDTSDEGKKKKKPLQIINTEKIMKEQEQKEKGGM